MPAVGASQDEAFARLMFLVDERRRCGLLTGPSGIGKTCLLRQVASQARRMGRWSLEIDATGIDAHEFAVQIAGQLSGDCDGDSTPAKCWSVIQQHLASHAVVNQPVVVLIDNMDQAANGCAHSARRLMNLADSQKADLTMLLASHSSQNSELGGDIELSVELSGWTEDETARFVHGTIRASGAKSNIFSRDAISAVQEITQGNPRSVIRVCDLSLLAAMNDNQRAVDSSIVFAATSELMGRRATAESQWQHQPVMRSL